MTSHAIGGRKLSRKQGPRLALYKNLIVSVLRYERIQTTEAKAKEIRPQVEGVLEKIFIDEGQYVEEGQKLFKVNELPYREALKNAVAEAQVESVSFPARYPSRDGTAP